VIEILVVDDESLARSAVVRQLGVLLPDAHVREARDGFDALDRIAETRPDLLFLDVEMPELSGLDLLRQIAEPRPRVIFVTAHDHFAVRAFEDQALDYLVKPFGRDRFLKTVDRLRRRLEEKDDVPGADRAKAALAEGPLVRLFARRGDRILPIAVREIRRIEAQGDYAEVHTPAGSFLLHVSLKEMAARLDPARFVQVHRSHIVNLDAIDHLRPHDDRRLCIVLRGGEEIVASRAASERLRGSVR
jgi:two-component system LytT family response regulator